MSILNKFGNLSVKFSCYYKHTLAFSCDTPEGHLTVYVGGDADSIYKLCVIPEKEYTVFDLKPFRATLVYLGGGSEEFYEDEGEF